MTVERKDRPWLDVLNGKHECGPSLSPYRTIDVHHAGRSIQVRIPNNLMNPERLEIRATLVSGPLLVLIASYAAEHDGYTDERGVFMAARAGDDGVYAVHVWHEMYPWALAYLGLNPA